jgi:PAS domain S-box-containing protein
MTPTSARRAAAAQLSADSLARLLRERDQLFLLHEALADVERARTLDQRLAILSQAIRRLGYGRVETVDGYSMPDDASVVSLISNSAFLTSNELIVPLRAVDGATVATLVLGEPTEIGVPTLGRVRTVELFAQQVASIIENARLYEESQRERGRGEALADVARAVGSSLRLAEVMHLSLRHALALVRAQGAALGMIQDDQIVIVAALGAGEMLIGTPVPVASSLSGRAIRESATIICNDANVPDAYAPTRTAANVERTLVAPLFANTNAIGVLCVINRDAAFTDDDAVVLQRLADQVAVAVANARLYEDAKASADRYRQAVEDERRARMAAAKSEARYTRLVESASDAIFTVRRDGALTAVNHAIERATRKSRDQLIGLRVVDMIDARDRAACVQALGDTFNGARRRLELRYPTPSGETRLCSLTLTPLVEQDAITGALGIVRDVTDEKRMTEQLIQQEKLAAVGQLVSGVAHELNNPLASVMAFAQLLLAAPDGAPHDKRAIDAINQEAKRAAKIVSNLLTFARQHQPERTITDLNQVVEDTLELRRYALRLAQIEVETRLAPDLPMTWADPFQLQQVMLNLITNAEQALQTWDGYRKIVLASERVGDLLRLSVSDSGQGIAPEHLSRIFNPFFTTKPVGEGTGLGLSISDGIVREHEGRIRVESRAGCGACFTVELPYVVPPSMRGVETREASPTDRVGRRLLVVDDEPSIRNAIATYFRSLGHHVDVAGSGREGIDRASSASYDALLLDLRLPDLAGDELLRELEASGRAPKRVVFITGDTQSESARASLESTGRRIIAKPFLLDELADAVLA